MRSDYIPPQEFELLLSVMQPVNRTAMRLSVETGLRISDVLNLTVEQIHQGKFSVQEQKTGKFREIEIPEYLRQVVLKNVSNGRIFPHRLYDDLPRTRFAVYKDIKRAQEFLNLPYNVSPHSARKIYAVNEFAKSGDLEQVQKIMNHRHTSTTAIYVVSDKIAAKKAEKVKRVER